MFFFKKTIFRLQTYNKCCDFPWQNVSFSTNLPPLEKSASFIVAVYWIVEFLSLSYRIPEFKKQKETDFCFNMNLFLNIPSNPFCVKEANLNFSEVTFSSFHYDYDG